MIIVTMAQALAEHIRSQIQSGEKVLQAADDEHYSAVFGNPADVLNVVGNVSDVAHTNHLWLLDMLKAGVVQGDLAPDLQRSRPSSVPEAVTFLNPRETDSPIRPWLNSSASMKKLRPWWKVSQMPISTALLK